jgi:hypothetical protein
MAAGSGKALEGIERGGLRAATPQTHTHTLSPTPLLQATPSEDNTLWFSEWAASGGANAAPGASAAVNTTTAAVAEAAARFSAAPVLFLGAVPLLPALEAAELPQCGDLHPQHKFPVDEKWRKERQKQLAVDAGEQAGVA